MLTWVMMPNLTRLLYAWLYAGHDACGGDVMTEAGNDPRATRAFVVRSPRANLLVVVLAAAAIAGCGDRSGAAAPPPLPVVRVASVIEEDVPISLEYVGTLVGDINAQIRARVSGHLLSQNYRAGSRAGGQNAQASALQARAALERAQADVKTQEANIAAARAAVADAKLNLGYTRVLSPITGVAGFRVANIGDYVGPNDQNPLTTVSQVDPIYAEVPISEQRALTIFRRWDDNPRARRDIELELILADGTVYPRRGRAVALDRQVDLTTGTLLARGVFSNPGNILRPGQYAKVRAVVDVKKDALLVPQRAVQDVQGVHQVAVVRADDTVDVRQVKTDARVGSLWIISEGLKPGERVVVEGGERVRTGQKVRLAESTPAQAGASK